MLLEPDKIFDVVKDLNLIKTFLTQEEGIRHECYTDHRGFSTIGIGFNCERSDANIILKKICDVTITPLHEITLADHQIEALFEYCIVETIRFIIHKITKNVLFLLNAHQQCAITSLVFNSPALLGPHLVHCLTTQQWSAAADEIRYHSNQHHDPHLQPRREREATLFLSMPHESIKNV